MLGRREQLIPGGDFDDASPLHHTDLLAQITDDA
jgi:hypothetical protein